MTTRLLVLSCALLLALPAAAQEAAAEEEAASTDEAAAGESEAEYGSADAAGEADDGEAGAKAPLEPPGEDAEVKERLAYWDSVELPPPNVPEGVKRRPPLSDFDRRTKRAQKPFSVIGVPQLGGNPDLGFIVGAVSAVTWHSTPEADPYYDFTPFDRRIIAQAQVSLKRRPDILARQDYQVRFIAPYWLDTLMYLDLAARYLENASAQYFGTDSSTMGSLQELGPAGRVDSLNSFMTTSGVSSYDTQAFDTDFGSFGDYNTALRELRDADDPSLQPYTFAQYHQYLYRQPMLIGSLRYALFGGLLTPAVTLNLSKVFIERYDGREIRVSKDERGNSAPTLLDLDCAEGIAKHCDGTWDNTIKLSLALDTRDFAADPKKGFLVDVSYEAAPEFLGSPGYQRVTGSGHFYINPFLAAGMESKYLRMVIAGRVVYSVQGGDMPFYARNRLSFFDRNADGLGGISSMRGYRLNRFVGNVMTVANLEIRYDIYSFNTKRSTIAFKLVPHLDAGGAYDSVSDTNLGELRLSGGGGLYLQWNQSNVIRLDIGYGDEGMSFGINYGFMY